MIHWFRTIDLCLLILQFLDNDDRMSSKRRNLSALVFLINSTTKANLIRIMVQLHIFIFFES